ncbi:unnamed protein product [Ascophyllum nodosum]
MEEWYSGGDTNSAAAAAVLGAPPATAGVAGKGYGDSFTPPTSRSGIIGGQAYGVPGGTAAYAGPSAGGVGGGSIRGMGRPVLVEDEEDYENEPPLLVELGINFEHIWSKTLAVILPTKRIDINYLVSLESPLGW